MATTEVTINDSTWTQVLAGAGLITLKSNTVKALVHIAGGSPATNAPGHELQFREGAFTYTGTENVYLKVTDKTASPATAIATLVT